MRGEDEGSGKLFSYVDLEARVRHDHPLRGIRVLVNEALLALERDFTALYSSMGRPSIPPEKLLRSMLLQALTAARWPRLRSAPARLGILDAPLQRTSHGVGSRHGANSHGLHRHRTNPELE